MSAPKSLVQDVSQLSGDNLVQRDKQRVIGGFVESFNTRNPTTPFRFKSAADYLANKKALVLNQNGSPAAIANAYDLLPRRLK